jgi:hypothetical protein
MATSAEVDLDRQVTIYTNEFHVLRYMSDTPLHLAIHEYTLGRFEHHEATRRLDVLQASPSSSASAYFLTIEERTEMWEEDIACTCGLAEIPIEEHDPGCMLVQAYLISRGLA